MAYRSDSIAVSRDMGPLTLRLLNALNSEDRGLKVRFSLATIAFETFELILCQMLSWQGKNAPSNPYPHYLVRLATSGKLSSGAWQGKQLTAQCTQQTPPPLIVGVDLEGSGVSRQACNSRCCNNIQTAACRHR